MRKFKNFDNITEARDAYIWDTKPKTLEDAEDPEIMTNGFGRFGFSQLKDKLIKASKQFADWAKDGNYDSIDSYMSTFHNMLETLQVIEKEMKKYFTRLITHSPHLEFIFTFSCLCYYESCVITSYCIIPMMNFRSPYNIFWFDTWPIHKPPLAWIIFVYFI